MAEAGRDVGKKGCCSDAEPRLLGIGGGPPYCLSKFNSGVLSLGNQKNPKEHTDRHPQYIFFVRRGGSKLLKHLKRNEKKA